MRDAILTRRNDKMHPFSNAWDAVVNIMVIIFTSVATCSFWMGVKSRQIDEINKSVIDLKVQMGKVLEAVAGISGQTVDGVKWRVIHKGE